MLYLHCGWLKTGTTSLQVALKRHHSDLDAAGIVNATQWRVLPKGLNGPEPSAAIAKFARFVELHAGQDILLSCETFMNMLLTERQQKIFLRLIEAAQMVMPVTCVWTLRRWDEMMRSYYLWQLSYGLEPPPFLSYLASLPTMDLIFSGMQQVESKAAGDAVYCKYKASGGHNEDLLRAFRFPPQMVESIEVDLKAASRQNVALSHKEVATLLNVDQLSKRAGSALEKGRLRKLFTESDFCFEGDHECELMSLSIKRDLHEQMLGFARKAGFDPYVRFFEEDEIHGPDDMPAIGPELVDDCDLARLLSAL